MNTAAYIIAIVISLLLGMGLYGLRLRKTGLSPKAAGIAFPLAALLGFVLGKALYVLLQLNYVWRRWGWASFLRMDPTQFSFFGGLFGVLIGVLIAGALLHLPAKRNLDAFAPSLALVFSLWKFSEYFLGDYASGAYVENEGLQFFPMAIVNQYEEWYFAIFMLAGLFSMITFLVSLLRADRSRNVPGMGFIRTAFYLVLPLVLCESLRSECMKWGFVKCEQLLCGVIVFAVILAHCIGSRPCGFRRWLPILLSLLLMVGLVAVEFILDKLSWPRIAGYSIMIALLLLLAVLEVFAARRHRKA